MAGKQKAVKETEQQRAMTELAINRLADYKKRWVPLQQQMQARVMDMGKPESAASKKARGAATTDNAVAFSDAGKKLEGVLTGSGAGPNSGKAKMAMAGLSDDQGTSRGLGLTATDQSIDDAYLQGLSAIASLGKGQGANAMRGMQEMADMSGKQARQDAEMSAARRAGNAQLVGTVASAGLMYGIGSMGGAVDTGFGSVPGGTGIEGAAGNNPSAYTAPSAPQMKGMRGF